jgi:uncharacterized phage infection (PIP) family protein YhgE
VVWALAVALVVALVAGGLAYRDGLSWRDRAKDNRREADGLAADLETTTASLEDSKADVSALEGRVSRLANEKAQAEDAQANAELTTQQIAELVVIAGDVANDLEVCLDGMNDFTDILVDIQYYDPDDVSEFVDTLGTQCGRARAANDELQSLLGGAGA